MSETDLQRMLSWVELCRAFVSSTDGPPYMDSDYDGLGDCPLIDEDEKDVETVRAYQSLCEELLAEGTADLGLRFAALYPLRRVALANPYAWKPRGFSARREAFLTLAGLCISEQLTGLREVKFELQTSYLAGQWDRGVQIFRRLSLLGIMNSTDLLALRGQYMFWSVWGRRIEQEFVYGQGHDPFEDYECFWPSSLPFGWRQESAKAAFSTLTRPEVIEPGTGAHWLLTAWSTNPRSPKPLTLSRDLLDFSTPDILPVHSDDKDEAVWREKMRSYVHGKYRDFEPISQPTLSDEYFRRLHEAKSNLEDAS